MIKTSTKPPSEAEADSAKANEGVEPESPESPPPSEFDGKWSEGKIKGKSLTWNTGEQDEVTISADGKSLTMVSSIDGLNYLAKLEEEGNTITWSDGDVWTREKLTREEMIAEASESADKKLRRFARFVGKARSERRVASKILGPM